MNEAAAYTRAADDGAALAGRVQAFRTMPMTEDPQRDEKQAARDWFERLQVEILGALETLEAEAPGPFAM